MKYGFIGLGNMATAIIKGMCKSGDFDSTMIYGYNRTKAKTTKLATSYGIQATSSIAAIMSNCDIIILGVKPQMLPDVLPELKNIYMTITSLFPLLQAKILHIYKIIYLRIPLLFV